MKTMNTPAMNTPGTTPTRAPLDDQLAEDLHRAVGLVEDWLLHASPETLDELAEFLDGPAGHGYHRLRWIIELLGEAAAWLRPAPQQPASIPALFTTPAPPAPPAPPRREPSR